MALDEIQTRQGLDPDSGGLNKRYSLVWANEDETNLDGVEEAFMRLKEEGVTAIIGAASSAGTLRLAPLANKHRILLLSPASSSPDINTGAADWVFRNYPSDTLEAQALANIYFSKDSPSKSFDAAFREYLWQGHYF